VTRRIAVLTGTRADFGLLRQLCVEIDESPDAELLLIATGTHVSERHGTTLSEITDSGLTPAAVVPIWSERDDSTAMARDTGGAIGAFAQVLSDLAPDVVVVLGDRLEAFAMATAATIELVPVVHIHGGELTEGAMDDSLRHSITKLSYLHFTTTDEHRQRVIQLGEDPARVFNLGAPIVDVVDSIEYMSRAELKHEFGVEFGNTTVLLTFHPAAFDERPATEMIEEILQGCAAIPDSRLIITGTNNDIGSDAVRGAIAAYVAAHPDSTSFVESFGQRGYLSAVKEADVVVGNSSSTVLEAPIVGTPSVLVGLRQAGRPLSASVSAVRAERSEIAAAIRTAIDSGRGESAGFSVFGTPGFAKRALVELARQSIPRPPRKAFWEVEQ
jgi:UDP-hydrolysing UDP-N-acetyl-D-glucosamine 2-epimerase